MAAGRPRGSTNHDSKMLKEMILGALADAGGKDYLKEQAAANPSAFLALIGKIVPKDVEMTIRKSILEEDPSDEPAGVDSEA
jgi:hypothetical protein